MRGTSGKFDLALYRDRHIPKLRELYGDSLERIEVRTPRPNQGVVELPRILAATSVWIRNLEAYAAATRQGGTRLVDDLTGIANADVAAQYDRILAEQGISRTSINPGTTCLSMCYAAKPDGRWDAKYYVESFLPMVAKFFGPDSVLRVEACTGIAALGGGKPTLVSVVNTYYDNGRAVLGAANRADSRLESALPQLTNIEPYTEFFDVVAVG